MSEDKRPNWIIILQSGNDKYPSKWYKLGPLSFKQMQLFWHFYQVELKKKEEKTK